MRSAFTLLLCVGILADAAPLTAFAASLTAPAATLAAPAASPREPEPPPPSLQQPLLRWPLEGPHQVARPFAPPSSSYGPGHRGVDLRGSAGAPVLAPADGTVAHAGPLAGRGVVSLVHADGLRTTYEPVTAAVAPGQWVRAGTRIGTLEPEHPGCPLAPRAGPAEACLHWGARRDEYLDPLQLLGGRRVRLLPWDEPLGHPLGQLRTATAVADRVSAAR